MVSCGAQMMRSAKGSISFRSFFLPRPQGVSPGAAFAIFMKEMQDMGVFLSFRIAPHRIPAAQWEETYQEALGTVDHFNLMDLVFTQRNGSRFMFTKKTAERDLGKGKLGIKVCGTMDSGFNTEEFLLFRNLECYRSSKAVEDNGADILLDDWYPEDSDTPQPPGVRELWGNKTQGKPAHIPLLAIGCLFADRFPDAVRVGGDITMGQCRKAVELANRYLERPIQVPVTCRAEPLARRLQGSGLPAVKQPEAFFQLYLGTLTPEVGAVLNCVFSPEILYQYFRNALTRHKPEDSAFQATLRNYLLLGLEFSGLLQMLVSDPKGLCLSLEQALKTLFSFQVHIPLSEKNCTDPLGGLDTAVDGDESTPHEIDAVMGRAFFSIFFGRNRNLPVYVPLDTIRDACRPLDRGADAMIDRLLAERVVDERQEKTYGNDDSSVINQLRQSAREAYQAEKEKQNYDIGDVEDLYFYEPGCTVYPALMEDLLSCMQKIWSFDMEKDFSAFLALDHGGREADLIRRNRHILIREDVWEHIFAHIMNDSYIRRYFFLIETDLSIPEGYHLLGPLLNNPVLVDELWEKAENTKDLV